jgi:hypothetical protein
MTRRIGMTVGIVAAVLLLAVLAGIVGVLYARPATAQTVGVPGMRQVTVVGQGEVKGRPDTATVQIGVETEAPDAKGALAKNTEQAQAIQEQLKQLGIAEKDMQTSNFNIYPTYGADNRQITGYHVSNSVIVKIRQLDKAGTLLDQVVQAGANSVSSISFSVEDPKALLNQAREQANPWHRSLAIGDLAVRLDLVHAVVGFATGHDLAFVDVLERLVEHRALLAVACGQREVGDLAAVNDDDVAVLALSDADVRTVGSLAVAAVVATAVVVTAGAAVVVAAAAGGEQEPSQGRSDRGHLFPRHVICPGGVHDVRPYSSE